MDAKIDDLGRGARRTCLLACVIHMAACGAPDRDRPQAERPRPPTTPTATAPCTLGEARSLTTLGEVPGVLGVAFAGDFGVVAYPVGESITTIALDPLGHAGATHTTAMPNADGLLLVAPMGDDVVVLTEGTCRTGEERCLTAGRFDRTGALVGATMTIRGHAPISRIRRASEDGTLVVALSTAHGPPWIEAFSPSATGLSHTRIALSQRGASDKEDDVLAVAGSVARFAVLHRRGTPEDPAGEMILETATDAVPIEALADVAAIERFVRDDRGYGVIASFEFDRPLALRIRPDGALDGPPLRLVPGSTIPTRFGPSDGAQLRDDGAQLVIVVRSATSDVIHEALVATRSRRSAASVARTRHGFLVPYVATDGGVATLVARPLTCMEHGAR